VESVALVDAATGVPVPCQWDGAILTWIERGLERRATRTYTATAPAEAQTAPGSQGVKLTQGGDGRLDVRIGDELFTSYHYGPEWYRPYFHPVIGPYGDSVTRAYPMVEGVPGETSDHPHHRGVWVAHGAVNSVDNWSEGEGRGKTVHREFAALKDGPVFGHAIALSDWVKPDGREALLSETRDMRFYNVGPSRLVDVDLTLTALEEDVLFGDTKEGGILCLRVASSMDVLRGGRLVSSSGGVNEAEVWGKRAHWCDYSGPVNTRWVGVACFEHPKSFRHPTYWHARDYGLLTANPFGVSVFEGPGHSGEHTLPAGESLRFRYRVYVHQGDATEGRVAEKYNNYVNPPTVEVSEVAP
jgi:hypothetical protein